MYTAKSHSGEKQDWSVYIYSIDNDGHEDFELVREGFADAASAFAFINYLNGGDGREFEPTSKEP